MLPAADGRLRRGSRGIFLQRSGFRKFFSSLRKNMSKIKATRLSCKDRVDESPPPSTRDAHSAGAQPALYRSTDNENLQVPSYTKVPLVDHFLSFLTQLSSSPSYSHSSRAPKCLARAHSCCSSCRRYFCSRAVRNQSCGRWRQT